MTRQDGDITGDNTLRVPVIKAAELLRLTEGAVRQRIKRGTLPVEKAADGSVYVLLDADLARTNADHTRTDNDSTHDNTGDLHMTVERLDSEVNFLRSELITRNEELRRKDHIIAALTERIPELEPAREPTPETRESPETASEEPYSTTCIPHAGDTSIGRAAQAQLVAGVLWVGVGLKAELSLKCSCSQYKARKEVA